MSFIQLFADSTLSFSGGGDFEIEGNDIKILRGTKRVLLKSLEDLLKTSFRDYENRPSAGVNYDKYIGRGLDENLKKEIEKHLTNVILSSEILLEKDFTIYSVIDLNILYIRIILFGDDMYTTNLKFDTTSGVTIG